MRYIKLFETFSKGDFENQAAIDALLDKINKYGKDSLTWHEKELLQNSAKNIEHSNEVGSEEIQKIANDLVKAGYLNVEDINIEEHNIEIYDIKDKDFPYFLDNHLRIGYREEDGEIHLDVYPEDYGEPVDLEERAEVFDWIENNWDIDGYVIWLSDDDLD